MAVRKGKIKNLPPMYVTLDQIVKMALIDKGEQTEHLYQPHLMWGVRGMNELTMDVTQDPRTIMVNLKANNTIDLPHDYVDWTKVGVCVNGKIFVLSEANAMCIPDLLDDCGKSIKSTKSFLALSSSQLQKTTGPWTTFYNYRKGRNIGNLFGQGGGFPEKGWFKVDKQGGKIIFDTDVDKTQIILEYITTGVDRDGTAVIHIMAQEALLAFIHWQSNAHRSDVRTIEKNRLRFEYYSQKEKARRRLSAFTIQDFLRACRTGYKLTPKF